MSNKMREKVRTAGSVQELLDIAEKEGVALTEEKAEELFTKLQPAIGELSDNELDAVSGGGCAESSDSNYKSIHSTDQACPYYQCDRCKGGETVTLLPAVSP